MPDILLLNKKNSLSLKISVILILVVNSFCRIAIASDSTNITPPTVVSIPEKSHILATGTIVGDGSSPVVQLITGAARCQSIETPYVQYSVASHYTTGPLDGIFVYPINPWGCWNTNKTSGPICDQTHTSWSGDYIQQQQAGGYWIYFRNEAYVNNTWRKGWSDINWTIYCINTIEYNTYKAGTVYGTAP